MTASPEIQEIAIVTGASTGIGAATARELARQGFHVLAGVRRDRDADAIRGPGIEPLIVDITNPDHIRALATRVHGDPQGRVVRALVNNAAIAVNAPVEAFAIDEWRRLFEVNLFGHIAVTQTLLPALIRSEGRVRRDIPFPMARAVVAEAGARCRRTSHREGTFPALFLKWVRPAISFRRVGRAATPLKRRLQQVSGCVGGLPRTDVNRRRSPRSSTWSTRT